MVNSTYYTTADVKRIFGWSSTNTIHLKRASGFLPPPDLEGRPNKWLKHKIDAIIYAPNTVTNNQKNDPR